MTATTVTNPLPDPRSGPVPVELNREIAPRIDATIRRLATFEDLAPDWDSYGGDPPTPIALGEARRWTEIVTDLFGSRVGAGSVPYSVAPLAHGGVQLEWRGRNGIVELEVGPDGELAYLFLAGGAAGPPPEEADDASWSDVLRQLLRALL